MNTILMKPTMVRRPQRLGQLLAVVALGVMVWATSLGSAVEAKAPEGILRGALLLRGRYRSLFGPVSVKRLIANRVKK